MNVWASVCVIDVEHVESLSQGDPGHTVMCHVRPADGRESYLLPHGKGIRVVITLALQWHQF